MFFSDNDISMSGSEYIRYLYNNTRDGKLTITCDADTAATYPMAWDGQAAEALVQRFEGLRRQLETVGQQYDALVKSTQGVSDELLAVWNTYVRPFPDHRMDGEILLQIWQKEDLGEALTESEKRMSWLYRKWYEENALRRLPYQACAPDGVISRAMRYARLVSLGAPGIVLENEARCLAEEMVLYYCARPFHICRCCGNAYEPDGGMVDYSVCPVCGWEEDDSDEDEYSHINGAPLRDYRKHFLRKEHAKDI